MSTVLVQQGRKKKRVGRGGASGKNAGRGHKGQRSRAGRRIRPALRDILQRLPKRRGHNKNRARGVRIRPAVREVSLHTLATYFSANDLVSPKVLLERGIVTRVRGRVPRVKIVASGALSTPLRISRCEASSVAREMIEKAGGTITV